MRLDGNIDATKPFSVILSAPLILEHFLTPKVPFQVGDWMLLVTTMLRARMGQNSSLKSRYKIKGIETAAV